MPLELCPVLYYRRVMKDIAGAGMSVKIEQDHERRLLMVLREGMGLWNVDPHAAPPAAQPSPAYMTDAV